MDTIIALLASPAALGPAAMFLGVIGAGVVATILAR